jgi:hypothetical protein
MWAISNISDRVAVVRMGTNDNAGKPPRRDWFLVRNYPIAAIGCYSPRCARAPRSGALEIWMIPS